MGERFDRKNLKAIQAIVQEKTGAAVAKRGWLTGRKISQMVLLAGSLMCFVTLCAFAYAKFSSLDGDDAGFGAAYQGDGRFDIIIFNNSDRELKLQDKVKVMQWLSGKEVEGDKRKIKMQISNIAPHSQGVVSIDLSEGYDIGAMMEALQEGDDYYFVLTNNNFAFGQEWMCFFDFKVEAAEDMESRMSAAMQERENREAERKAAEKERYGTGSLLYPGWIWPTVSLSVSGVFGAQVNGKVSDHINIAGADGDEIYAVADGLVTETGFDGVCGNYILVDLGDGISVKYGHLKKINTFTGEEIRQGQVIAELGKTGIATGPNLLFEVTVNGEKVNPLAAEQPSED